MQRICGCGAQAGKLDIVCDSCGEVLSTPPDVSDVLETEYIPPASNPPHPITQEDIAGLKAKVKTMMDEAVAEEIAAYKRTVVRPPEVAVVVEADVAEPKDIESQGAILGAALLGAIFPGSRIATMMGSAFGKYVGSEMKAGAKLVEFGTVGKNLPAVDKPKAHRSSKRRKKSLGVS